MNAISSVRSFWLSMALVATPLVSLQAEKPLETLKLRERKVQELVARVLPSIVCITNEQGSGTGSGVIINKEGLILTAGHVTNATGKKLEIIFPDGKRVKGTALGANLGSDAGLAKIDDPGTWPYVEMGDSNEMKLGDWCVAMGHPGGFNLDRKPPVRIGRIWRRDVEGGIFTDCTLIGGDSGGPLFDLSGKVVGIHSSINASADHNRHIAIDSFRGDWEEMKNDQTWGELRMGGSDPKRAKLGLTFDTEDVTGGAEVVDITPGTPTEKLGIKPGDRIVKFDGSEINNYWSLMREISDRKIGDKVKIETQRGPETLQFEIELLNKNAKSVNDKPRETKRKTEPKLEPEAPQGPRPYFGATLDATADNAAVSAVSDGSPAAKAGLESGDVIVKIDGEATANSAALADLIRARKPGDKLKLEILRGKETKTIELTLETK
jgi:serine protease Do